LLLLNLAEQVVINSSYLKYIKYNNPSHYIMVNYSNNIFLKNISSIVAKRMENI